MSPAQPRHNLEAEHRPHRIRHRLQAKGGGNHVGDAILGAIDGGITSFAVVAGAVGAGFSSVVVVILGFASVLADGFSIAVSNYLATKSEKEAAEQAHREEQRHIDAIPEGQREELRQVFASKGFEGETLERIVETISGNRELWAETVVQEMFGLYTVDAGKPFRAGLATLVAFLTVGVIPLMPFLFPALAPELAFATSAAATSVAFIAIGFFKGPALGQPPLRASLETLLVGGSAALLAYGIGALLQSWIGSDWGA